MKWINQSLADQLAERIEPKTIRKPDGDVAFEGWHTADYLDLVQANLASDQESSETDKDILVRQAVRNAAKKGQLTAKGILQQANRLEAATARKSQKPFVMATTVSLPRDLPLPSFRMNRATITFGRNLPRRYSKTVEDFLESRTDSDRLQPPSDYLRVRVAVRSPSPWSAFELASLSLDLLRGFFNLHINRARGRTFSTSRIRPSNRVLPGPLYTLHEPSGKAAVSSWWYTPEFDHDWRVYSPQRHLDATLGFVKNARRLIARSRYRSSIEKWLVLYTRALDEPSREIAFLKLWTLLERLTLIGKRDRYEVLARRASFVFEEASFHRSALEILAEIRNSVVHHSESRTKEANTLLHQLRHYVESLLEFHIVRGREFRSMDEVRGFLSLPPDRKVLRRKRVLIDSAISYMAK